MKHLIAIIVLILLAGCDIPGLSEVQSNNPKPPAVETPTPPEPAGPSAAEVRAITEATVAVAKLEAEMEGIRRRVKELNDAEEQFKRLPAWRQGRNALDGIYDERGQLYVRYLKIERDELPAAKTHLEQLTKAE